ncbi:MAG: MFS transporter [Spongiibacteraceae bacterium]
MTSATPHTTTVTWGERMIMLMGGLPAALALMALTSVLPKIDAALAHTPHQSFLVKQLIGAVGLAMVVGAPAAGFLVHRIGLRNLLVGSLAIYAIAGTAGLYISDLPILLTTRLCLGFAAASFQIMSMTLINTRLSDSERPSWMGRHIAFAMIGTIFFHPVAGMLGDLDWRGPFALYALAIFLLPAALQAKPALLDNKSMSTSVNDYSPQPSIFRSNFPWHYLLLAIILGGIAYLPMVYAPYLLRQNGVSSSTFMSLVLTADSLAGAMMALCFGRARRRLSHYDAFAVSLAFAGCGALLAVTVHNLVGVIVGLLIYGMGIGWFTPNLMTALAARVSAYHQGSAAGIVKSIFFLSAPLFITIAEPVARKYGPTGAMAMIVVLAFSLLIACVIAGRRLKPANNTTRYA